jgi:hypothetical protein
VAAAVVVEVVDRVIISTREQILLRVVLSTFVSEQFLVLVETLV